MPTHATTQRWSRRNPALTNATGNDESKNGYAGTPNSSSVRVRSNQRVKMTGVTRVRLGYPGAGLLVLEEAHRGPSGDLWWVTAKVEHEGIRAAVSGAI